jgi:hypothetical protein
MQIIGITIVKRDRHTLARKPPNLDKCRELGKRDRMVSAGKKSTMLCKTLGSNTEQLGIGRKAANTMIEENRRGRIENGAREVNRAPRDIRNATHYSAFLAFIPMRTS